MEVYVCEACEGEGADQYGTCWTCGGTGFVDEDGFMADEPDAPQTFKAERKGSEMTDEIEDRRNAIELLLRVWEDSGHDGCACMGPQPGHDLCPCDERRIAVQHLEDSLKFLPPR